MLLAYLIPGLSLIGNGRFLLGLFMLAAQFTVIGWPIGIYLAVNNLNDRKAERRHRELIAVASANQVRPQ